MHELEIKCWGRLAKLSWRPFEEARAWARSLGLKTSSEWHDFCAGKRKDLGVRPADIPSNPDKNYKNSGWVSISDWIASDYVSAKFRNYLPFEEARKWARECKAKSYNQWVAFVKETDFPEFIPRTPEKTYAEAGWVSFGDWLGTGTLSPADYKDKWRPFEAAREWVHNLDLKGVYDWRSYTKGGMPNLPPKPDDIPASPDRIYKGKGWIGYGDWVGTGFVHHGNRAYLPFNKARDFVRKLRLLSANQWRLYSKGKLPDKGDLPDNIPAGPNRYYESTGWVSWGDWLGTNTIAVYDRIYRPFEEARQFVRTLKIERQKDWDDYCKGMLAGYQPKPDDIPAGPSRVYAGKGWKGYGDWLGTERIAAHLRAYRSFTDARTFIHSLKFKTKKQWELYSRGASQDKEPLPHDIPKLPERVYAKDGWIDYPDWLGVTTTTGPAMSKTFLPFDSARALARTLGLKTSTLYRSSKLPPGLPRAPQTVYKSKGWVDWTDWLTDE